MHSGLFILDEKSVLHAGGRLITYFLALAEKGGSNAVLDQRL
jgi:hypothetical protein